MLGFTAGPSSRQPPADTDVSHETHLSIIENAGACDEAYAGVNEVNPLSYCVVHSAAWIEPSASAASPTALPAPLIRTAFDVGPPSVKRSRIPNAFDQTKPC